jgi:uncharacterized protein
MTSFNLRAVKLRSGEVFEDEVDVQLEPLEFGGQRYLPVPGIVPARLRVTRATTGTVFELGFRARLHGPCYRCLTDTVVDLRVEGREYQANDPQGDEELRTPYLVDEQIDLSAWARDALVLALPPKILCKPDCAGLCPECGRNLNDEPHEHEPTAGDSRWEALEALREQL